MSNLCKILYFLNPKDHVNADCRILNLYMVTLPEEIGEGLDALLREVGEGGAHVAEQRPRQQPLPLLSQPQVRVGRLRELQFTE